MPVEKLLPYLLPAFAGLGTVFMGIYLIKRRTKTVRAEAEAKPSAEVNSSLSNMIANLEIKYRDKVAEGVTLTTFCPPELSRPLYFEREPIRQSICDLLAQATHNTKQGRIHLHVTSTPVEMGQHKITIIIADTGAGFSEDALIALRTGTDGLICLARDLARRLGGDLTIESRLGKGTEVNLSFLASFSAETDAPDPGLQPNVAKLNMSKKSMMKISADGIMPSENNVTLDFEEESSAKGASVTAPKTASWKLNLPEKYLPLKGRNILIVDDSEANRQAIKGLLDPLNPNMVFASNGLHAIMALRNQIFDIILMDIHMPELNGIEASALIRENEIGAFRIPIIALTADSLEQTHQAALKAGIDRVLTKPVTMKELYNTLLTVHATSIDDKNKTFVDDMDRVQMKRSGTNA